MDEHHYKMKLDTCKVIITALDGKQIWATVYTFPNQRVQDVLNDERPFLPVQLLNDTRQRHTPDTYRLVLLNKSQIWSIEEA